MAEVTEIRLMGSPNFRPRNFAMASVALEPARVRRAAAPELEPGQLSASAEVQVTFRLQPDHGSEGNS